MISFKKTKRLVRNEEKERRRARPYLRLTVFRGLW
jgi:hypothetical protein